MNITNELYEAFNREYIKQHVFAITTQQAKNEIAQFAIFGGLLVAAALAALFA